MTTDSPFDFSDLRAARETLLAKQHELQRRLQGLEAERNKLMREREEIAAAPPAPEELIAALDTLVDREADAYAPSVEALLLRATASTQKILALDDPAAIDPDRLAREIPGNRLAGGLPLLRLGAASDGAEAGAPSGALKDGALFWLFRDAIKAGLRDVVGRMDRPAGLPMAERAAKLEDLDGRIESLEEKIHTMRAEAREALAAARGSTTPAAA